MSSVLHFLFRFLLNSSVLLVLTTFVLLCHFPLAGLFPPPAFVLSFFPSKMSCKVRVGKAEPPANPSKQLFPVPPRLAFGFYAAAMREGTNPLNTLFLTFSCSVRLDLFLRFEGILPSFIFGCFPIVCFHDVDRIAIISR